MRIAGGLLLGLFFWVLANATMLSPMVVPYIDPRSGAGVVYVLIAAAIGTAVGGLAAGIAGPMARAVPLIVAGVVGAIGLLELVQRPTDFLVYLIAFVQAPFCALGSRVAPPRDAASAAAQPSHLSHEEHRARCRRRCARFAHCGNRRRPLAGGSWAYRRQCAHRAPGHGLWKLFLNRAVADARRA